jgi:hypothetical protein
VEAFLRVVIGVAVSVFITAAFMCGFIQFPVGTNGTLSGIVFGLLSAVTWGLANLVCGFR